MKKYKVYFGGMAVVEAESKKEAEQAFHDMPTDEFIDNCMDGIEIERIKPY